MLLLTAVVPFVIAEAKEVEALSVPAPREVEALFVLVLIEVTAAETWVFVLLLIVVAREVEALSVLDARLEDALSIVVLSDDVWVLVFAFTRATIDDEAVVMSD